MTFKELYDIAVPEKKRAADKINIWLYLVVRPLSIFTTLPLLKTRITPTAVTQISVVSSIMGFFFLVLFPVDMLLKVIGWALFFNWAILDCVDGNIARAKNQCSEKGELWDAIGGYTTMVLIYFAAGIVAFYDNNLWDFCGKELILIFGGATSVISIFPRLIMHKKHCISPNSEIVKELTDKKNFSLVKSIASNFISVIGLLQFFFLLSIVFHLTNVFITVYFVINTLMMFVSIYKVTK